MSQSVSADPRIGTELAGYRIERLLGRGGMSVVYLAYHERLDRRVALKLLAPELSQDEAFRERFLRESKLAASLDHPNVIPIYDADEADGVLFIAMRYVEGRDLAKRLAQDGWLESAEAVSVLERVADALDSAHRRGLVHRDVKPGNVLLSDEGHVYLADFGLTRRTEEDRSLTQSGHVVGTIDYVAPEQIDGKGIGPAADVYALGCVLFECLVGEVPFRGHSTFSLLMAHLQKPPPSARQVNPELPDEVDRVLAKALAKRPEDRYGTCGELATDAQGALGLSGEVAQPLVAPRRRTRRLLVAAVVALLVVVAVVVPAVLLTGGGDEAAVGEDWNRVPHVESVFGGVDQVMAMALAEGDGRFVAVGIEGTFPLASSDGVAWTSQDGLSWTRSNPGGLAGPEDEFLTRVVFGPMGFVAVGVANPADTTYENLVGASAVWTSPDGGEWTRVPHDDAVFGSPDDAFQIMTDVTSGGPGFVAVGAVGDFSAGGVWTSPDGMSWTRVVHDPEAFSQRFDWAQMLGVASAADGQRLVAVGHDTGFPAGRVRKAAAVWVSLDSVSWTRVPHDDAVFGDDRSILQMDGVVAGGPGYVAVGVEAGPEQLVDGIRFPFANEALGRALVNPGGSMRGAIWTSPDGLTWTRVPDAQLPDTGGENVRLYAVTTGGSGLVAVGWRGSAEELNPTVWTSLDGETWSVAADREEALRGQGGQFMADVIAGGPGMIAVGADGVEFGFNTAIWTSP